MMIIQYLEEHEDIDSDFLIIDDGEFKYREYPLLVEHWIQTEGHKGFSKEKLNEALKLVINNEE